jgi:hypothetical protein
MNTGGILLRGVCPGKLRFGVTLMPGRSSLCVRFSSSRPSVERIFHRLIQSLGYARHLNTSLYCRPWESLSDDPGMERIRIVKAGRTGRVEPAERRPLRKHRLRRPKVHVLDQKRGWNLVDWWLRQADREWRPESLFLRQEKKVRAEGVDWVIDCDGYWEPSERKGLELDLVMTSQRDVTPRTWQRLQSPGFMDRVRRTLRKAGLRPGLTPRLGTDDFAGKRAGIYLATFGRTVRPDKDWSAAARAMLSWSISS